MSYFQDYLQSKLKDKYWGDYPVNSQQEQLKARWFEIVAGAKVQVWKWIYIGCTVRYKFGKKISNATTHLPFDVIGWGLNEGDAFGLNYYIALRIPLQKNPPTLTIQKK